MHYRSLAALLFVFAVSLSSSQPWSGTKTIKVDEPYNATFGPFNLQTTAKLSLTYTHPVQVCIVNALYHLPRYTEYTPENCLFYINATKEGGDSLENIPLLQLTYQIGVYFSDIANLKKDDNTTVALTLTGQSCSATSYWDGNTCVPATVIHTSNETISAHFQKGETKYWTYQTGSALSHLTFSLVSHDISPHDSVILARYGAGPFLFHDGTESNGTLTVVSPRQGTWVFSVHSANGGDAEFKLSEFKCGANSAGAGCTIPVHNAFNNMSLVITPEDGWLYLRFPVDQVKALLVSITTSNTSNIPYLYASNGQIPVRHEDGTVVADIHNCNGDYCSVVRSISRNITAPSDAGETEEWYIGIFTDVPGNTTFGLWFDEVCVPNCTTDNHGECEDSGRCACEIDFDGLDCSVSKGLGPQYIVLIIIASLVVASAIIGFVAWAYMRRKRANYEIVS